MSENSRVERDWLVPPEGKEGVPNLEVMREVQAMTVGEAMDKFAGRGAGQAEMDWVLANSSTARTILNDTEGNDQGYFFFPEATVTGLEGGKSNDLVPCVYFRKGKFYKGYNPRNHGWFDYSGRVVLKGAV